MLLNLLQPFCYCIRTCSFASAVLFFLLAAFSASAQEVKIAVRPDWVKAIEPEFTAVVPLEQINNGVFYLLTDFQSRIEGRERVRYAHIASKAASATGLEKIAQIEIQFDPAYQKLTLHEINVWRAGKSIPKLSAKGIRVLQREKELEYQIYDGSKTANIFLEDVRVGDVVEYSYTLRGSNPVFGGLHFGSVDLQWKVPVKRNYARLLWPTTREIYFKKHLTEDEPQIQTLDKYREYLWDAPDLKSVVVEDDAPDWYDPYPFVGWSEFKDWASVVRWALPLYARASTVDTKLRDEIERIKASNADAKGQLLAVLRFAQREIRYLGVEIGAGSHAPNAPEVVLARQFGDCKDKTLLVLTMLKQLGIEAKPALVNTRIGRGILTLRPTPGAFNHVIVRAQIEGQTYWLDPTRPLQKGTLATLFQPHYGFALVIEPATFELEEMKNIKPYKRTVRSIFDSSAGFDQPVPYTITTELEGESAEQLRNKLANLNSADFQKQKLNFYAGFYADISVTAPFKIEDDELANKVVMTESYNIKNFWKRDEAKKRQEMEIYAQEVRNFFRTPKESIRTLPLSVDHPVDITHVNEALLPQKWADSTETTKVDDDVFGYEQSVMYRDKKFLMRERLQSLTDHVLPADMSRYTTNLKKVRASLGQTTYWHDKKPVQPSNFNWIVAIFAGGVFLTCIGLAWHWYRYDPPNRLPIADSSLQGFGGWLILPTIGVFLAPLFGFRALIESLPSYGLDTWDTYTSTGNAAYHFLMAPLLLFELTFHLATIVFSVLLIVLFIQKRRSAPLVYIILFTCAAAFTIIDLIIALQVPSLVENVQAKDWGAAGKQVLAVVIWGFYFYRSRRVKATFVNEWNKNKPPNTNAVTHASS